VFGEIVAVPVDAERIAAARRPRSNAAEAMEIDYFSFVSGNSSRQDACRPLNRRDPRKRELFCNPERRGVEFIADVAAARDESE
jgi:hypothetical protein